MPTPSFKDIEKSLYTYWDELDIFKELDPETFKLIYPKDGKANLRSYIIKVLREGILDTPPDEDGERTRYVLSASEIQEELNKLLDEEVTLSNVYFHLQKLEEADMVKIVASLPSGKRFTSYYGRTARVFLLREDVVSPQSRPLYEFEKHKSKVNKVSQLIEGLNPEVDLEEAKSVMQNLFEVNNHLQTYERAYTIYFKEWVDKNEEILREIDINLIDFYFLYHFVLSYTPDFVKKINRVVDLLKFDLTEIKKYHDE